jgi:aminobenzoyl-glutamate transport protein
MQAPANHRKSLLTRFLDTIERTGNRLPDPVILFFLLAAIVPFVSSLVAWAGWSFAHPATGAPVTAVNLLTRDQVQRMFTEAVANFTAFPPLGTVLVAMIGIGVAERSGLIATALKLTISSVPSRLVTAAAVFAGIMSSMAVDAGYVVLVPLGAIVFAGLGRHPVAGICAVFAGVSGGFSANLLVTSLDPLLAGFTQSAAQLFDPDYLVAPTANYYFMVVSVFVVTLVGWFVTERIVEPRLGKWTGDAAVDTSLAKIDPREKRAVAGAAAAALVTLAGIAFLALPENALLRDADGTLAPFFKSMVPLIAIFFVMPGLVYGIMTGAIRDTTTVARMTGDTIATMGSYIVLAFAAAQFVAYFGWSNLGLMSALAGAELVKASNMPPVVLLLAIVMLSATINLFIGSASAKWGLMAPVIVPMMMTLGFSPELAQVAYRIGDSTTNIITPLLTYFPLIIAFAQKYDPGIRVGSLISYMLPYSVAFAIAWSILLVVWYVFGLPLGPDAPMLYPAGQ